MSFVTQLLSLVRDWPKMLKIWSWIDIDVLTGINFGSNYGRIIRDLKSIKLPNFWHLNQLLRKSVRPTRILDFLTAPSSSSNQVLPTSILPSISIVKIGLFSHDLLLLTLFLNLNLFPTIPKHTPPRSVI